MPVQGAHEPLLIDVDVQDGAVIQSKEGLAAIAGEVQGLNLGGCLEPPQFPSTF